jgi:peptidoglycan/LPS O-acetylase OafA/YrhL
MPPETAPGERPEAARFRLPRWLEPYSRITSSGEYQPEIDGLRFVAILFVYIYHLAGDVLRRSGPSNSPEFSENALFHLTQELNIGVPMFFVISGFILGLPFAKQYLNGAKPVNLRRYFIRRVTRLEPPYLISLLLFFLLKMLGGRGSFANLLPHFLASSLYLHNFVYWAPSEINIVAWSLEIEVQFYVLAPILALVFKLGNRLLRLALLFAAIAGFASMSGYGASHPIINLSLLGNGQYFLAGFLLAEVIAADGISSPSASRWDWIGGLAWGTFFWSLGSRSPLYSFVSPFLMAMMYLAVMRSLVFKWLFTRSVIVVAGGMCYSIYLVHNYLIASLGFLVGGVYRDAGFAWRLGVQFLLITPCVLLVSAAFFRLIERPCMRPDWVARLARRISWRSAGGDEMRSS